MSHGEVREAYQARADEYTALLGSMGAVHPEDRDLVRGWAARLDGTIVDAGCGPGHWTEALRRAGADVFGVDIVPRFVDLAAERFPESRFRLADPLRIPVDDGALAGVLSWYSVIHTPPAEIDQRFEEFARTLRPRGELLVGFFTGARCEPFDHAVTTAYRWPPTELAERLSLAGFDVLETHERSEPGVRPHGALRARLRDAA